jgi:glycosyltransferase involved in cell wall biosynthesis
MSGNRKRVLILQGQIAPYRRPLFNALGADYDVTVLHAGPSARRAGDQFSEIIVPSRQIGGFYVQSPQIISRAIADSDATIAMFDLHWPAYLLPIFTRRKCRFILHGHRYKGSVLPDTVRDILMQRADCLLMYGDEEVDKMVARGIRREKIVIAPNTVEVGNYVDFSGENKSSVIFVGRLQERKRIDLAIRAFGSLRDTLPPNIVFDIVGSGEIEHELRQLANEVGVRDRVIFHGSVEDNEILASLFRRAVAYVSPGPVGLGVLHSFAFGVPVITLQSGRHGPEFWNLDHGVNAIVASDEASLFEAIRYVFFNSSVARTLGQNAYLHYSGKRTLHHLVDGFKAAIEGGSV